MGYYTRYKLHTDAPANVLPKILDARTADYGFLGNVLRSDQLKWYEHEDDMLAISAKFPKVTFRLDGEGEESLDVWRKWFKGGKKIGETKAVMPPDAVDTSVTEVDCSELERLAELESAKRAYEEAKERLKAVRGG